MKRQYSTSAEIWSWHLVANFGITKGQKWPQIWTHCKSLTKMIYLDNSAILRALTLTKAMYFQKRCSQTLTDLHDLARIYRGLCLFVFSTGPQLTKLSLQTSLRSTRSWVAEKLPFSKRGWWKICFLEKGVIKLCGPPWFYQDR